MTALPKDIEDWLRGISHRTPMKEITERLFSEERRVLADTWGAHAGRVDGIYGMLGSITAKYFPYKIHPEHKKLLFMFAVGCLARCGITVTKNSVHLSTKDEAKPESILSGHRVYPSSERQKAFIVVKRSMFTLFAIGAFRTALAVSNVALHAFTLEHNLDFDKQPWYDDAFKHITLLRECLLNCFNEGNKKLFEDDELFKDYPDPPKLPSYSYCEHGVALVPPFLTACVFEHQKGPQYAGRMCYNNVLSHTEQHSTD